MLSVTYTGLARLLVVMVTLVDNILATHFRGGTISWKSFGGYKVEFFFKMGWTYNKGPGCTETKIGQFMDADHKPGTLDLSDWICLKGCANDQTVLHSASYYCMAANQHEDWEQGQMSFNYTFPNSGPFVVAFEGNDWMKLGNDKGGGLWHISTDVDLRPRSDTGKPNNSPVALSQTMYYMQYDCKHVLRIFTLDPDGDKVRCEWAVGDECASVCNALPGATLDPDTCTITFESTQAQLYEEDQFYAVALTIKDYPRKTIMMNGKDRKTPSDSLTKVPLQFLIYTPTFPVGCDEKPRFMTPTPGEGSEILVQSGDLLSLVVAADNSKDLKKKITVIDVIGPINLRQSALTKDNSRANTFQKTLTWQTSDPDIGQHIVCLRATNERGKTGDPRCFSIKIVPDPCDKNPCVKGNCQSNKGDFVCSCIPGFTGVLCDTDIDDCSNPYPCQNGGSCHDLVNDYSCDCVPGYTDKDCSTNIDECSNPYPCQNGGSCLDLVNDYSCDCVPGYADKDCSTNIDECQTDPCQNGGTCVDLINDYDCICVPGFTDKNCYTNIDECQIDPCENGGTCVDLINDYDCFCVPGYTDKNCFTDIDECQIDPCENGGTCADLINDYDCFCVPGFTDKNCSTDIDECQIDPCENGGTCVDLINDYDCFCVPGFTDKNCSTDIDECQIDPCENGGTCADLINDYDCICVPGFTDKNCSTNIDECASDPCLNGGNCKDEIEDFTCLCQPGFTGKNCHIGIDFCTPNPCHNGGLCHNSLGGFTCECLGGWNGKTCDYRLGVSKRATCKRQIKKASSVKAGGHVMKQDVCCPVSEYSKCQCFISPRADPEKIETDQTTRDFLSGLMGFPIGLGLSFLTYILFWRCAYRVSEGGSLQKFRAKHPPAKRSISRTEKWIDGQIAPVETPEKTNTEPFNTTCSRKPSLCATSIAGEVEIPVEDVTSLISSPVVRSTTCSRKPSLCSTSINEEVENPVQNAPSVVPSVTSRNIYRASISDDGMHRTGVRKQSDVSGAADWSGSG